VGKPERTDYSVTLERLAPYLTFGILIASWEAASRGGLVSSLILPPPSLILETCLLGLVGKAGIAYHIGVHALHSLTLLAAGFVAGTVLGVAGGIVLGLNATLYRAVNPILSFVLPIPAIAWAPVAMIWIGVGWPAVFAIVTYACVAEIIFNVTTGIRTVPRQYVRQVQTFGAHRAFIVWRVILPSAFPYIFTGLKLGLAASWRSLIGAEMFAGVASGLGLMLYQAQDFYATDVVFSALLIIAVVSLAIEQIGMRAIENRTLGRWGLSRTLEV
jgi:ABC-type nitrate/sulfonate/bicarbonate transport system permease component